MRTCIPLIMVMLSLSLVGCDQMKSLFFKEDASKETVDTPQGVDELTELKNALESRTEELELVRRKLIETRQNVQQLEQVRRATMTRLDTLKKERDGLNAELESLRQANQRPVYQRDEFVQKIRGLTPQELIQLVGKPVRSFGENNEWWYYNNLTCHPVSGELDSNIQVMFTDGRVSGVTY